MGNAKKKLIEINIEKFIRNNFDKRDRKKDNSTRFEWFVNSMHIWHENSQYYNSDIKIGKQIAVGYSMGIDAFYITTNDGKLYKLDDDMDNFIESIKDNGTKILTFNFIQSKLTEHIDLSQFLSLIDIPLTIWKGNDFDKSQPILKKIQDSIDKLTDTDDTTLKCLEHKIHIYFYTNKNGNDIQKLEQEWKNSITNKRRDLKDYFSESDIKILFRGSDFLNEEYEKMNSNEYLLNVDKDRVIQIEESKYLIGYITAKELLDAIAPKSEDGKRSLYPDVFKHNIRLYLGPNEINKGIEKTLKDEPEKFHYYNNGLTITTKEIKAINSKCYSISPVNIVNGCQTSNSIYNVYNSGQLDESNVKVPVRIIVAKDSEDNSITIRTNTQNGTDEKDLISINAFQKELQEQFERLKIDNITFEYKRQKGEITSGNADFIIQIDDILRAVFSTIMLIPNKTSGYFDKTTLKYIDSIFDDKFLSLYILITAIYKLSDDYITERYSQYNRLRFHILYLLYRIAVKNIHYKEIEAYLKNPSDSEDDNDEINRLIQQVYNILNIITKDKCYQKIVDYIISVIETKYPQLIKIETKNDEKILYKAVEKLKGTRITPVFEAFAQDFPLTIDEINASNSPTNN